uniref:secondary thiamine-phosphate synthase enzyme YjbQ n=1 Tax=Alkanindiges illinoisensis TaxID=197183 RepID=UPI0005583A7F|nr:secondary thiamine-phosphate synthase enzyme YjbQ [Alkanindiges illinoisensis]
MQWQQKEISLKARPRGFHLVTHEIVQQLPELAQFELGLLHLWIQHTSASLSINENADPDVRLDFESFFNRLVPEGESDYRHNDEGPDDLPAHFKTSLLGCELTIPIRQGRLRMGTWQGIYLGEHRDQAGSRQIVATLQGQAKSE